MNLYHEQRMKEVVIRTLSLQEAATFLQISQSGLRAKAKAGSIPGAKIGKSWVFN